MSQDPQDSKKAVPAQPTEYFFGEIKEFNLEQIESEVLNESLYLDVFAGSDMRLKTNVNEMTGVLAKLKGVDAITYQWRADANPTIAKDTEAVQVGLVAQQVAEIFPELVKKDETTGYLTVNYTKLTAHLVVAIKELNALVQNQQSRIEALEKKSQQLN